MKTFRHPETGKFISRSLFETILFEQFEHDQQREYALQGMARRLAHQFPVTDDLLPTRPAMGQTFDWPENFH